MNCREIIHILWFYLYKILADVGIYITLVQPVVLIELLFWHTQNATNGLSTESEAFYLAEDKQHRSTRTVPTERDGLFEKQGFCHVVVLLQSVHIHLFAAQPYRKAIVGSVNAVYRVEIQDYFVLNACILGAHRFRAVVWQLDKQQRIYVDTQSLVGFRKFIAFLQRQANKMLRERHFGSREVECRIDDHTFLYHLLFDNMLAMHLYLLLRVSRDRCGRDAYLQFRHDILQHLFRLLSLSSAKHVFLVDDDDERYFMFRLGATGKVVERCALFGVANHKRIVLVDALPVDKQYFAWMYISVCRMVHIVIDNGMKLACFGEEGLHLEVALFVQLVRCYPHERHFRAWCVGTLCQFGAEAHKHL